jgi:hypothetical protein
LTHFYECSTQVLIPKKFGPGFSNYLGHLSVFSLSRDSLIMREAA